MAIPQGLLQGIERLDPLPITLQRLVKTLEDENVGSAEIAEHVQFDPAVAASVLRVANSAAYMGTHRVDSLRDAILRLGTAKLLDIVLGDYLRRIKVAAPMYDLAEDDLWLHSAAASLAVKALMKEKPQAGVTETASIAALVHDIGKLVMVRFLKADVKTILERRDDRGISFVEAERELFECDHAEVGAEIAKRWGFPEEVAFAIAHHHDAPVPPNPTLDAVVVANLVAKAIGTGLGAEGMDLRIDDRAFRRLGIDFAGFSRLCIQTMNWLKDVKAAYHVGS